MTKRKTLDKKTKVVALRMTAEEHRIIKTRAAERGWSITALMLEALREYWRRIE